MHKAGFTTSLLLGSHKFCSNVVSPFDQRRTSTTICFLNINSTFLRQLKPHQAFRPGGLGTIWPGMIQRNRLLFSALEGERLKTKIFDLTQLRNEKIQEEPLTDESGEKGWTGTQALDGDPRLQPTDHSRHGIGTLMGGSRMTLQGLALRAGRADQGSIWASGPSLASTRLCFQKET